MRDADIRTVPDLSIRNCFVPGLWLLANLQSCWSVYMEEHSVASVLLSGDCIGLHVALNRKVNLMLAYFMFKYTTVDACLGLVTTKVNLVNRRGNGSGIKNIKKVEMVKIASENYNKNYYYNTTANNNTFNYFFKYLFCK